MVNRILEAWWARSLAEAQALAAQSDRLELELPPDDYDSHALIAHFRCRGLVCERDSAICEAHYFVVGVRIPAHYLRQAETFEVLTVLAPQNVWHPNIIGPGICIGMMTPGMGLVDILCQVYEVLTWQKYSAHHGINEAACAWARDPANLGRFPIDRRPLKRGRQAAPLAMAAFAEEDRSS